MFFKRYIIRNINMDGIEYQSIGHTIFQESFKIWKSKLTKEEIKALKKYRRSNTFLFNGVNINAKIRNGKKCREAIYLSSAINKFDLLENIVVYRTIGSKEQEYIKQFSIREIVKFDDYKGAHVSKEIKSNPLTEPSGYILFLLPKGSKVAYINNITIMYRHEKELLIGKGQQYLLVEKRNILNKEAYVMKLMG